MKKLHPNQSKILQILKDNITNPLSILDLSAAAGIDSPGVLYHHLKQLERKGYLKRNPNNPKDYMILDSPEKPVVYINKYGLAQCGPQGIMLDGNIVDTIPIATSLLRFPATEAFIVEAKGDSMEPNIKNKDIVIARRDQIPNHNDIIVCVYKSEAWIKKFCKINNEITLHSFNFQKYNPMLVREDDGFSVQGVVKNILSYG